jgi:hypothetical protein
MPDLAVRQRGAALLARIACRIVQAIFFTLV